MSIPPILRQMLSLPTAAFVEDAVLEAIERRCRALPGVSTRRDRFGNLMAHYRHRPAARTPLVFSAHTDHPGFVAREMLDRRTLLAEFRGGVYAEYFPGQRVRFWSDGAWVVGRVIEVTRARDVFRLVSKKSMPEEVRIRVSEAIEPNSPGMWDLPDPYEKGGSVYARGCDDLAGAAGLMALLDRLARKRTPGECYCLFTRAEEVGFIGAIAACKAGTIPRGLPIVAIETSSARGGGAEIGGGPVLRVGDLATIFTPALTDFCGRVATDIGRRRKAFRFQRKLMAGGTCETTAYMEYGYAATGICLALGNYHNMDVDRGRIAAEYVSLSDWKAMVDWFAALATDPLGYTGDDGGRLKEELDRRFEYWRPVLEGRTRWRPPNNGVSARAGTKAKRR